MNDNSNFAEIEKQIELYKSENKDYYWITRLDFWPSQREDLIQYFVNKGYVLHTFRESFYVQLFLCKACPNEPHEQENIDMVTNEKINDLRIS